MFFSRHIKLSELSDQELIDRYRNSKDNRYVGELFKRYTHLIYGVCIKYLKNQDDAHDLTMELFEKLLVLLLQHKVDYFKGWIYQVVRNECLMKLRKDKSTLRLEQEYESNVLISMESSTEMHLFKENNKNIDPEKVNAAVQLLNPGQKECIDLFYLKKHSYKEVAEKTGFTLKEVKSYIQNGKRNLKTLLLDQNGKT